MCGLFTVLLYILQNLLLAQKKFYAVTEAGDPRTNIVCRLISCAIRKSNLINGFSAVSSAAILSLADTKSYKYSRIELINLFLIALS